MAYDFIKSILKKSNILIYMMYILQKKEKVLKVSFLPIFKPQKVHLFTLNNFHQRISYCPKLKLEEQNNFMNV